MGTTRFQRWSCPAWRGAVCREQRKVSTTARRRKRRRAVVVVEEEYDSRERDRQAVAKQCLHSAQKRSKISSDGPAARAGMTDRQLHPVQTLDDPRLAPCFGAAMRSLRLVRPTPVQSRCWPVCIARRDAVVIAPTGSGKLSRTYCS